MRETKTLAPGRDAPASRTAKKSKPRQKAPAAGSAAPVGFDPDAAAASGSGIYGLGSSPGQAGVIVVPVPFEATTSYGGGTSGGPRAVLAASRQVDLFDRETGRPYQAGIAMLPIPAALVSLDREARRFAAPIISAGGRIAGDARLAARLERVNALCERMNAWVYETTAYWLGRGRMPVALGGDHSIAFGSIQAYAEAYPGMGILHVDAHADLRDAYEGFTWSHASIFYNVLGRLPGVAKLVQVGLRDLGNAEDRLIAASEGRIRAFFDADLAARREAGEPFARVADEIVACLPEIVYLSWDIDGLDPTLCPHTGTPVPGGLSWSDAIGLLRALARSGKRIVGLDLCEVAPGPRGDEWDANVAARLLYKMIGFALSSARASA